MPSVVLIMLLAGSPVTRAQALARRSIVEYDAGEFEKALVDATRAYELAHVPGLLFDLGQCHRALHHWERAAFFYRGYLRGKPSAKNRAEVLALIAEMDATAKEERLAQAVRPPPEPPASVLITRVPSPPVRPATVAPAVFVSPPPPPRSHVGPWVVGALGVASVIGGALAFGLMSANRVGYQPSGYETVSYASIQTSNTEAVLGEIFVPVGVALLATAAGISVFGAGPDGSVAR
ncbi:MAG: hypothetical protein ACYCWW_14070 [Deltaproteobacteria bacterium]